MPDRALYHLFVGLDVSATTFTATWRTPTSDPVKPVTLPQTPACSAGRRSLSKTGFSIASLYSPARTSLCLFSVLRGDT